MSLPIYDNCRPSSNYFLFNERQPDESILAINNSNNNINNNNGNGNHHGINHNGNSNGSNNHYDNGNSNGSYNDNGNNNHHNGNGNGNGNYYNNYNNSNGTNGNHININENNNGNKNLNLTAANGLQEKAFGVFLTKNDGMSWTDVSTGFPTNPYIPALAAGSTFLYAGTTAGVWSLIATNDILI